MSNLKFPEPIMFLHFCTKNDTNGNPRRLFVGYNADAEVVCTFVESYRGKATVQDEYPDVPISSRITITPGEYRQLKP